MAAGLALEAGEAMDRKAAAQVALEGLEDVARQISALVPEGGEVLAHQAVEERAGRGARAVGATGVVLVLGEGHGRREDSQGVPRSGELEFG